MQCAMVRFVLVAFASALVLGSAASAAAAGAMSGRDRSIQSGGERAFTVVWEAGAGGALEEREVEAVDLAAQAVASVQAPARKPRVESMRKAFGRALARGWRYTGSARHIAVQVPRASRGAGDPQGSVSRLPGGAHGRAGGGDGWRPVLLQDFYSDGRAEVTVWGWDDGDPSTVEGTIFLYSHDTGEEFYFDVQHFAASDTDGWVTWGALIDYRGGWAYRDGDPDRTRYGWRIGTEFGGEVELRPAALQLGGPDATISAYSRERCLRQCLNRKMNNVFNATRGAAMTSFLACTRSPATRAGLLVYASCVGGGTLGGFAIALTNEFVFTTSCEDAC